MHRMKNIDYKKVLGTPWWGVLALVKMPDNSTKRLWSTCIQLTKEEALEETKRKCATHNIEIIKILQIHLRKPEDTLVENYEEE